MSEQVEFWVASRPMSEQAKCVSGDIDRRSPDPGYVRVEATELLWDP